jgi:hypothetical protein
MGGVGAMLRPWPRPGNGLFSVRSPEVADLWRDAGWRKARPVSGELRLRNGAAVKRINGGCKSLLTAQRSEVKQAGNRRSQAPRAAHSLLVCPRQSETARKSVRRGGGIQF